MFVTHGFSLDTPIREIRLPTLTAQALRRLQDGLGIATARELLWHLPLRYEKPGTMTPISALSPGADVTIEGTLERLRVSRTMRKKITFTEGIVADPTGRVQIIWFHQPWMATRLKQGDRLLLAGKVTGKDAKCYLANPVVEVLQRERSRQGRQPFTLAADPETREGRISLTYGETEGITSRWLNYLISETLRRLQEIADPIPENLRRDEKLLPLGQTLFHVHFPETIAQGESAKQQIIFRDVFALQCAILSTRASRTKHDELAIPLDASLLKTFLGALPFQLTSSQRIAAFEILRDMEKPRAMHRLLVGDVGSGKTIVAALAILNAIRRGKGQVALMAPTEILARQHFATLAAFLKPFAVRTALLTGSESSVTPKRIASETSLSISRPKLWKELAGGDIQLLIGTHALITTSRKPHMNRLRASGPPPFAKLLLAIIDEQHRFGVLQRKRMQAAGHLFNEPHLLTLTATPIPRTLALTLFGDLDVSFLTEMPAGRKPIVTKTLSPRSAGQAFAAVKEAVRKGRQAFIICPLVSLSEKIEARAAKEEFERLRKEIFPELKLGLLHGQMKGDEKATVMKNFRKGAIDILVATPVVEVGIDIPNAAVMVVLGAERFGLAQLYQFRGRVGRGEHASCCFFLADQEGPMTRRRLHVIEKAQSGLEVAEADLKLRGPGELLGTEQSGIPDSLMQALGDLRLIEHARNAARNFLSTHPLSSEPALMHAVAQIRAQLHLS